MDKYLKRTIERVNAKADGHKDSSIWVLTANGAITSSSVFTGESADEIFNMDYEADSATREEVIVMKNAKFFTSGFEQIVEKAVVQSGNILAWGVGEFTT